LWKETNFSENLAASIFRLMRMALAKGVLIEAWSVRVGRVWQPPGSGKGQ